MIRRIFSVILLVSLILSVFSLGASAEDDYPIFDGTLTTSDACIEMIKDLEGYIASPKWDVAQHSIGYGCNTTFAKKYGFDTEYLSKDAAHELMLFVLEGMEKDLNAFLTKYDISINQYQYDALISFTYNLGKSWMTPNTRLAQLLIDGRYTVNEFASAFGVYCHIGTGSEAEIDPHLVSRRIQEIKLFLYGAYNLNDVDEKFCRINFDPGDGEAETDVAFYQEGEAFQILFEATSDDGSYFRGWVNEDGEKVTAYDTCWDSMTLYADYGWEWEDPELYFDGDLYEPDEWPELGENIKGDGSASDDEDDEDEEDDFRYDWETEASDVFYDIYQGSWYYGYVNDLYNLGVINGYEDATFRPERTVTTGEALKMILLAADYGEPEPVMSHWARCYLDLALDMGIIERGDITDLDVPISRAMMAKIAANALGLEQLYDFEPFTDTSNRYACALFDWGITEGYEDGTFRPDRSLTRAELSAIVWRIQELFG